MNEELNKKLFEAKDVEEIKKLVEQGADINAKVETGATLLFLCQDADMASELIRLGANVNVTDQYGNTPLLFAVQLENEELIKLLINSGADVNAKNEDGVAALHYAYSKGVVEYLLDNNANIEIKNEDEWTPLFSYLYRIEECMDDLLDPEVDDKEKIEVKEGIEEDLGIFNYLIQRGANVNAQDNDGNTLLHYVSFESLAKLLIHNGADVNIKNKNGDTPLHVVDSVVVAKLLLGAGADKNITNNDGKMPIDVIEVEDIKAILR